MPPRLWPSAHAFALRLECVGIEYFLVSAFTRLLCRAVQVGGFLYGFDMALSTILALIIHTLGGRVARSRIEIPPTN